MALAFIVIFGLGGSLTSASSHTTSATPVVPAVLANVSVTGADGSVEAFAAAPARWNAWHPQLQRCPASSRWRCNCPIPPGPQAAAVSGPVVAAPAMGHPGLGPACGVGAVHPAPRRTRAVLLARRGGCAFREKAAAAQEAGYCGLLVVNKRAGPPHPYYGRMELPDMTAEGRDVPSGFSDASVGLPAWLIAQSSGDALLRRLARGAVLVEVRDVERKPPLGHGQEDEFGLREHWDE
mmetsp:Transcript_26172/g.72004  ORF Transcript_26172/g.72004 Transcript_26172/m.72004 type:complete len:237 (-) Transcript_26172:68-778(-)|eukprot:CAMPEP_0179136062 /NCGR_PEP_ID=MMETSP0796-20121207/64813_1 /TAXON_ID=73915 /ORGANISM="Pyrodinium bahamense, Strain pbaha01" /LENGTH=236 /DNA_ID=CAMNT_0020835115 /DNA_START=220 /DNA_END=930 /DNA_ORIENTATION=+